MKGERGGAAWGRLRSRAPLRAAPRPGSKSHARLRARAWGSGIEMRRRPHLQEKAAFPNTRVPNDDVLKEVAVGHRAREVAPHTSPLYALPQGTFSCPRLPSRIRRNRRRRRARWPNTNVYVRYHPFLRPALFFCDEDQQSTTTTTTSRRRKPCCGLLTAT